MVHSLMMEVMRSYNQSLYVFFLFLLVTGIDAYYPVLCIAGFADNTGKLSRVCDEIANRHPGTETLFIQPGGFWGSYAPMWSQVESYRVEVDKYFAKHPDGVNIVAHSQGTLIMRAIIQSTPDHPVRNLINVNSPFLGTYGIPFLDTCTYTICKWIDFLSKLLKWQVTQILYSKFGQNFVSVAGYWHDPTDEREYLKHNIFLPVINNLVNHENFSDYKENFLKLHRCIMIAGSNDKKVIPYQSGISDYFNKKFKIVPMKSQKVYENDTFGLRTLDESGRLIRIIVDAGHEDIVENKTLIDEYIVPYCD